MKTKILGTVTCLSLAGCATLPYQPYAREVKRQPGTSGIIALKQEHQGEDRAKADSLMASNCGSKTVRVTEEGEIVTGTTTASNASKTNEKENQGGMKFGSFVFGGAEQDAEKTAVSSTTTALKEWQIAYQCVAAEESPAPKSAKSTAKR